MALALVACGQTPEQLNNDGNAAFLEQDYTAALINYVQAYGDLPDLAEPPYNIANVHYRQEDYEQAQGAIERALIAAEGQGGLSQHSFYNLGNIFFQSEQYETAIEAYKEALRLNPNDIEAKQNLELALRQLQQQHQEEQQDQREQDQDNEQQDNEQQEDQNQENEQQDNEQQDDQNQENEQQQQDQQDQDDEQEQDADQQQDQEDQENDQQQQNGAQQDDQEQSDQRNEQPQQVEGLTEEQARQLFAAASQGTESLEEFLQQIYLFPGGPLAEDW
jgi:hypothetical protein